MAGPGGVTWADATRRLATLDPALGRVIARAGPVRLRPPDPDGAFGALVRAIAFQQLAGAAAAAIHARVRALVGGPLTPEALLAVAPEDLRGAGLSAAKSASVRDLAERAAGGGLALDDLAGLDDDDVVERLGVVRGIGPWTAQMFLLFELRRPDVWPTGDLGVREGWRLAHDLDVAPTPSELGGLGERLRPVRSAAAWYCWQAVHLARAAGAGSPRTP